MPVPLAPVQVLQRAQQVWHAQQLPPYVQFTSRVQDRDDPVLVIIRTSDGAAYTRTLPQNSQDRVYVAPGVRLTGPYGAPLGFCVSMVHCSGVLQTDPFSLPPAQPDDKKVIASVHAYADAYGVSFGPATRFHGRHVYDLVLQPRYDPRRYEIRDMLIDASDYRMWQITYEVPSGQSAVTIRYDFGPVPESDGVWYLQFICVYSPQRANHSPGGCTLASTSLWNFALPAAVPDWYFDPQQYKEHEESTQERSSP